MKSINTPLSLAATITLALLTSGCSNLTPEQNQRIFGSEGVGGVADNVLSRYGVPTICGQMLGNAAYSISKASVEQREVALARARRYYARLDADQKKALKQKRVRYLAVNTTRDGDSSKGQPVMKFDTVTQELTSDSVYTLDNKPKQGTPIKLDTHAEYIGNGGASDI